MKLLILLAFAGCATTKTETVAKREGGEVKCAAIGNGPVTEVCVYPMGVLCFGGDKGISCLQPLAQSGGPG